MPLTMAVSRSDTRRGRRIASSFEYGTTAWLVDCEALGIGVPWVHRRIKPAVGDHPSLHRAEQFDAIGIIQLEFIGEAAEFITQRDLVRIDHLFQGQAAAVADLC